jgi:hypothetical protein
VGGALSLADIHIASYLHYPVNIALNSHYRNKCLDLMRWFNKMVETAPFHEVYGSTKLLTNPMRPPNFPKRKAPKEAADPDAPEKEKKKKKKKGKGKGDEAKEPKEE